METWAVDNRERLSSAGNLWETVLSRVTKQNWAGEKAEKPGQAGVSETLLPLSASLFMAQITSCHTSVWTPHGSYMMEQDWFSTCWMHGWASVNQHAQTPKPGFPQPWKLRPGPSIKLHVLLSHLCSSLILILCTTSFSLLVLFCHCGFLSSSSSKSILTCDDSFLLNHEPILSAWVKHILSRSILS